MGPANWALEPLAALARVALAQNLPQVAFSHVNQIVVYLEANDMSGVVQSFWIYLTCYRALEAAGDSRAQTILERAVDQLKKRAGRIEDAEVRDSFLSKIQAHRKLLAAIETK